VDFQLWIADGDQPLPLRAVLTYRREAGQPQFRAQFSDWNFEPVDLSLPIEEMLQLLEVSISETCDLED
jgi:Predicted periplasmic protein (DUF2092)